MYGLNASVNAGWYTFSNLGPITTTFSPAPSCTSDVGVGYVNTMEGNIVVEFATDCADQFNLWTDCMPTTTSPHTTAEPTFTGTTEEEYEEYRKSSISWEGYAEYYSPGLYCPSGWETVGMVGRDNKGTLTSSGILSPATPTTETRYQTGDDSWYYPYEDAASVMKGILEPKQTMALCCPRSMTADTGHVCYSIVKQYTPTFGCQVGTGYNEEYAETTYTYTDPKDGATEIRTGETTTTLYTTDTYTTTLGAKDTRYRGIVYAPVITLLHHESDFSSATPLSATGNSGNSGNSSNDATPSNIAGRLSARAPIWDGVGTIIGISVAAMALGATMILPW